MTVTVPPRPPRLDEPDPLDALIEEARRHARRRRRRNGAYALLVAGIGTVIYFGSGDGGRGATHAASADAAPTGSAELASVAGAGRWGPSHGPNGGLVSAIAVDPHNPKIAYATTLGAGVFRSTDGARSWHPANAGLTATRVDALAVDPVRSSTLYVGTGRGVFKSADRGRHWRRTSVGVFKGNRDRLGHRLAEGYVSALAVDPRDPQTVYAGAGAGLFKSTDGGATWQTRNAWNRPARPWRGVGAIALDPRDPSTVYISAAQDLFESKDGGRSWQARNGWNTHPAGAYVQAGTIVLDPRASATVYVVTTLGLFKSTDSGTSWHAAGPGKQLSALVLDPRAPDTLYATAWQGGIFKSSDGGASWRPTTSGLQHESAFALATDPSRAGTLYAGVIPDGVVKSTDGGGRWRLATTGLTAVWINALAVHPESPRIVYAASGASRPGVFGSADAGRHWHATGAGLPTRHDVVSLAVDPRLPGTVYAGTLGGGLFKTVDGGLAWHKLDGLPRRNVAALAIDPSDPATAYAGAWNGSPYSPNRNGGIYKTSDGGRTWRPILTDKQAWALAVEPRNPEIVYAGTRGGGVVKTEDGGRNWTSVNHGLNLPSVRALAIDPHDPSTIYVAASSAPPAAIGGPANIYRSTDGGDSWQALPTPRLLRQGLRTAAVDPSHPGTVYAGSDNGVFRSTDGGDHWLAFNAGLSASGARAVTPVGVLVVSPSGRVVYAGTEGAGVVDFRYR